MKSRTAIKTTIMAVIAIILLVGCSTVQTLPNLPTLKVNRPERPTLVEAGDLVSTQINMVRLMGYAERLEIYSEGLETWVDTIIEAMGN